MTSIENNISDNKISDNKITDIKIKENNDISNEIIKKDDNIKPIKNISFYDKYKIKIQFGLILFGIIVFLYFLYKMKMINFNFTNISLYNNNISTKKNNSEFEKLTNNDNNWNIEDAIEKLIKNQNIYFQEKKL